MAIDYDAIFGGDDYDPCAALRVLRPVYMKLLAGGSLAKVSFRDRTTEWHRADLAEFKALISQLEAECSAKNGGPRRRFAVTAGARRVP